MAQRNRSESPPAAATKASLKAWWKQFTTTQRMKRSSPERPLQVERPRVFGRPLRESLQYASVQISTGSKDGELYVWGYIPVVVAKCGLFLKENATELSGVFRVNGSAKRMRELQALFETPPRYGKNIDLKEGLYTPHDVASVFRRYLTSMPEPVIPHDLYHDFRQALAKVPFNQDECIQSFKRLIRSMPRASQYLLLYVLDLLSVFARKSDKNLMTAANLAVIFRPGMISHPDHELSPDQHRLSQDVLEFMIAHQDWFMLDIPPPPQTVAQLSPTGDSRNDIEQSPVLVGRPSDEEDWRHGRFDQRRAQDRDKKSVAGRIRPRRHSASERSSGPSTPRTPSPPPRLPTPMLGGLVEGDMDESGPVSPSTTVTVSRSRTMPARAARAEGSGSTSAAEDSRQRNVLRKKGARTSVQPHTDDSG
ncbi:hypothetical protein M422DRAFT_26857 [Sphaerobolus stellatus SS14]|nr:hypothetical protein M422DRAFT_26857 [Sphaerobolus stellatus SS14]